MEKNKLVTTLTIKTRYWYQNKNGSMWTYDVTDHLMVGLETVIALSTLTYIVETICMSCIQWMNECSMISSMINGYVLL